MCWFNTQPSQCILQLLFWGNYCLTVTTAANLNWYVLAQESPNQQEEEESLGHIQIKSGVLWSHCEVMQRCVWGCGPGFFCDECNCYKTNNVLFFWFTDILAFSFIPCLFCSSNQRFCRSQCLIWPESDLELATFASLPTCFVWETFPLEENNPQWLLVCWEDVELYHPHQTNLTSGPKGAGGWPVPKWRRMEVILPTWPLNCFLSRSTGHTAGSTW